MIFYSPNSTEIKKKKTSRWQPSWSYDRRLLVIFYLQVAPIFPTKFSSQKTFRFRWSSSKYIFKMAPWQPSLISDRIDLAIFDLQVTLILPIEFQVSWLFNSGDQNRFSRW